MSEPTNERRAAPGSDCCWIGDPCPEHNPGFERLGWEDVEILLRAALDDDSALDAAGCLKDSGYVVGRFEDD